MSKKFEELKEESDFSHQINNKNTSINNNKNINETNNKNEPFSINIEDDDKKLTPLDQIFTEYGYGPEVIKIIFSIFLCFVLNGYLTTSFCSYVLGFRNKFKISNNKISLIGTSFFITKFLSSLTVGYQAHFFGRIRLIHFALLMTFLLNLMCGLICNYYTVLFVNICNGIFSGIYEIATFNIGCEFTPIKFRGWILLMIWNGYNFGVLFPNIIMLFTMPKHQAEGLQPTLLLSAFVIFICVCIIYYYIKDSPRNNILKGNYKEAFNVLIKLKNNNTEFFTDKVRTDIVDCVLRSSVDDVVEDDIRNIINKKTFAGIKELFSNGMGTTFMLLLMICFFGNIINDGFQLILNLMLDKIKNEHEESSNNSVLKENILINSIDLPSNLLLGIFTEFKLLGRRHTQALGFFILGLCIVPVIIDPTKAYIYLIFFMFFTCITNMVNVYVSEIYPTKSRDLALGVIQAMGYFGSCISQYLLVWLNDINVNICPILFLVMCLINSINSLCLKVETVGRPLDVKEFDDEEIKKDKKKYLNIVEMGLEEKLDDECINEEKNKKVIEKTFFDDKNDVKKSLTNGENS
jgi:sugar phosphate permease